MTQYTFYWQDGTTNTVEESAPTAALNKVSRLNGLKPLAFYSTNPSAQYEWNKTGGYWLHVE